MIYNFLQIYKGALTSASPRRYRFPSSRYEDARRSLARAHAYTFVKETHTFIENLRIRVVLVASRRVSTGPIHVSWDAFVVNAHFDTRIYIYVQTHACNCTHARTHIQVSTSNIPRRLLLSSSSSSHRHYLTTSYKRLCLCLSICPFSFTIFLSLS